MFSTAQAAEWATDPNLLDNVHKDTSASCSPETDRICADSGDCLAPASFPAIPANEIAATAGTAAAQAAAPNGGWVYNAYGSGTCASGDNWVCISDPADVANHVLTLCTGAGTSVPADISIGSDTNCITGYTNCDGVNDGECEIQELVTSYPLAPNAVYTTTCAATCDASHLSCTGATTDAADDGDGCEITMNTTAAPEANTLYGTSCSARVCAAGTFVAGGETITVDGCNGTIGESCTVTATSLAGTCTGVGTTGTAVSGDCACTADDVPEFAPGGYVDSDGNYTGDTVEFSTSTAMIRGDQNGTGGYVQFGDDSNSDGVIDTVNFEIDNTGAITAGTIGGATLTSADTAVQDYVLAVNASGEAEWVSAASLSGSGDDLGNHTATQGLIMGTNKIIGASGYTNGLSVDSVADTGNVTVDGTVTVSGGDIELGDATTAGLVGVSDGAGFFADISAGTGMTADTAFVLPPTNGTNAQVLITNGSGVTSWADSYGDSDVGTYLTTTYPNLDTDSTDDLTTTDLGGGLDVTTATTGDILQFDGSNWANVATTALDTDSGDDVTVGATGQCSDTEILQYVTDHWECVAASSVGGGAQTLDDAYDTGTDAATRTIAIDGDAVKFDGSHLTNNVFELAQTNVAATGDVFELINSGLGNALVINDGTDDALVVDVDGKTIVKQLNLVASVADGTGKPTATCNAAAVGDIAYATLGGSGNYYGCKEVTTGVYSWVALEVFGS